MRYIAITFLLLLGSSVALADSRCEESQGPWGRTTINCTHQTLPVTVSQDDVRSVLYQVPLGTPPAGGWPVVFIYQGSYFTVHFNGSSSDGFGGFHQIRTIRELLDNGFAVIAPPAGSRGFWDTNSTSGPYENTADYTYLSMLFDRVADGTFGPLNPDRMYATGLSSGGYNTSRMAVSFPGRFRALAIHAASYATCAGMMCSVPWSLPSDHPPTLFLHGTNDWVVPAYTMNSYYNRLESQGFITRKVTDSVGHEWLSVAPEETVTWFLNHP